MKFLLSLVLWAQLALSIDPFKSLSSYSFDVRGNTNQDDGISQVMDLLKANLTMAVDQTMIKLDSILLLNGHGQVSHGLRLKISKFKDDLCLVLKKDLKEALTQYFAVVGSNPLLDSESFDFSQVVLEKWEETLTVQLESFQQSVLPEWIHPVLGVWKGVEKQVLKNIKQFKTFVNTSIIYSPRTCSLPKPLWPGFSLIESSLKRHSLDQVHSLKSPLVIIGELAIISLAISGVIALAIASPFWITFIGLWIFKDHLAYRIHGPLKK